MGGCEYVDYRSCKNLARKVPVYLGVSALCSVIADRLQGQCDMQLEDTFYEA